MFAKIKQIGKGFTSLKGKLLLMFLTIVIVMGGISIGAYWSMKSVNAKLNSMVETTILANSIKKPAEEVRQLLSDYFLNKTEQGGLAIQNKIARMAKDVKQLKRLIRDEEGQSSVDSLADIATSYGEAIQKAVAILNKNNLGQEYLTQSDEVKNINGYLNEEIQNLLTIELHSYQKTKAALDRATALTGLSALIAIILVGCLVAIGAYIYLNKMIGALLRVAASAGDIADGNLRVAEMKVKSRDEVAELAQSFTKMSANLRGLIGGIMENSTQVADSAEFLKSSVAQSSQVSEQIAVTIQQVSQGAAEQALESQKTVRVVTKLLDDNQKIFENALRVLEAAGQAAGTARNGNENVNRLMGQIAVIEKEILSAQTKSDILKQRSDEIGAILSLITGMAEQTNLLSLNASIEAARAGEYGKGFAVVANEVRKLADGSAKAVEGVAKILEEIHDEAAQVAAQMAIGVEKVRAGTAIAQETRNAFELIVNASNHTDDGVKKITGEIQKMIQELNKVVEMSETIAAISEESSASSQEVAAATEQQTASLEEVSAAAVTLSNMAADLQKIGQRFQL